MDHKVIDCEKLSLEYGGIDRGILKLIVKADDRRFEFLFDELLSDPVSQLVRLLNAVQSGENLEVSLTGENYYRPPILKISVTDKLFVTAENEFVFSSENGVVFKILIVNDEILLRSLRLGRKEVSEMITKILSSLLNDKFFPYYYPCFLYCRECENFNAVTEKIMAEQPQINLGEALSIAFKNGELSLKSKYEIYIEKYEKMLNEHKVPEGWY